MVNADSIESLGDEVVAGLAGCWDGEGAVPVALGALPFALGEVSLTILQRVSAPHLERQDTLD